MRKFIALCSLFIITVLCACKTQKETAANNISWKKTKVFVYTKNGKGYVHDNIAAAARCIQELGAQNGFAVDVSDDPAKFNDDNLKQYNALVFTSTNNDVFDNDAQKLALMHYIQAGGGFVGIHSVTGTERNWPWFKRLVGGTFERHAKHQPFTEIIIDHNNPSTSFLPNTWKRDDECYYTKEINPDIHVLMVHDLSTVDDKGKPVIYGNTFPSVWCHEFDGGREWYTSLGHDSATYKEPEFRKHIMGGLQWVLSKQQPLDYSKAHAKTPNDPLPY
ncbi:ThuA domain-containing protein [Parafilimonas sp.]|uniref:ThuA domain-containing protein n=1 Tax=Parafilimonas sp. TaxID=1969739 RepID=UPI003F7F38AB